jgi:hypothetical protein
LEVPKVPAFFLPFKCSTKADVKRIVRSAIARKGMARPLRVLKHRAPSDKAFLFDRKAHKRESTSPADRSYHLVDLRFFTVDGGIGAKQWSFHGAIADAG